MLPESLLPLLPASWPWHVLGHLPWRGVLAAALAAGAWTLAWRRARRPEIAALGAALGLLLGWWVTLGLVTASPRQLAERLPLLALAAVLAGALLASLAAGPGRWRPWAARIGAWLAALAGGWWMAGGPLATADLQRALPALAGVALAAGLLWPRLSAGPGAGAAAFAALALGLLAAGAPGPQPVLAAAALAATLAALLVPGRAGAAGSARGLPRGQAAIAPGGGAAGFALGVPLALGLVSLAAVPVLARGGLADAAAAAAPVLGLLAGPVLGRVLGRVLPSRLGGWAGFALAAAPALLLAVAAARFR